MSLHRKTSWIDGLIPLFAACGTVSLLALPAAAYAAGPWATGSEWFSVRAGYAKSTAAGAADGNVGFGFGYTRFRNNKWAYGATAQVDVLGRFGSARELEIPWTIDVTRHYKWPTPLRPYLGAGAGIYYHQFSGTGADASKIVPGGLVLGGMNTPISDHGLLGLDVRMSVVKPTGQTNPVFGGEINGSDSQSRVIHWSVKLNYAWVF